MLKILIAITIVIFGMLLFTKEVHTPIFTSILNPTPTPTPLAFKEMTIPYLRSKEYKSQLGELEKFQEKPNYTSYLTSYDSDGLKINGLITVPHSTGGSTSLTTRSGPWPAVIFVHGYIAPTIYQTTTRYVDYVDYLARNGFVVFKIDLRGHGNSEGDPGGAYYSEDYVIDTLNAYSALQNTDFVNTSAIGLWGHSMAGNVVTRAFAVRPDIKAVVVWAGAGYTYTDLTQYRLNDQSYRPPDQNTQRARRRQQLFDAHGQFNMESNFWSQVAITNYLNDLKGAIQIHHAIDDGVVSVEYSRNLMKLLDQTTVKHELFEYSTGGHNIIGSSFGQAMSRTVEFFRENLTD